VDGPAFLEFRRLFREGFEAARKHCDRITTLVELMQKDSALPCFAAFGEQTSVQLRERFQPLLTHSLVGGYVDRLIDSSLGSHWTRLYDTVSLGFVPSISAQSHLLRLRSINTIRSQSYDTFRGALKTVSRAKLSIESGMQDYKYMTTQRW